jgi:hypothetical protein
VGRFAADASRSGRFDKSRTEGTLIERRSPPCDDEGEVTGRPSLDGRLERGQHRYLDPHSGLLVVDFDDAIADMLSSKDSGITYP